jgi:hypothetical protein
MNKTNEIIEVYKQSLNEAKAEPFNSIEFESIGGGISNISVNSLYSDITRVDLGCYSSSSNRSEWTKMTPQNVIDDDKKIAQWERKEAELIQKRLLKVFSKMDKDVENTMKALGYKRKK